MVFTFIPAEPHARPNPNASAGQSQNTPVDQHGQSASQRRANQRARRNACIEECLAQVLGCKWLGTRKTSAKKNRVRNFVVNGEWNNKVGDSENDNVFYVQVPGGMTAGDRLEITHPRTHQIMIVTIPDGVEPGGTFPVPYSTVEAHAEPVQEAEAEIVVDAPATDTGNSNNNKK